MGYIFYLFLRLFYWILKLLPQWHCFVFFFILQHVFHVYWWYSKQNNNLNFANWFSVIYPKELDIKILQKQFPLTHFFTWISNGQLCTNLFDKKDVSVIVHLYGSWIYNYLSNQWLSPLTLWVPITLMRVAVMVTISW